jgi:hypothetical protein
MHAPQIDCPFSKNASVVANSTCLVVEVSSASAPLRAFFCNGLPCDCFPSSMTVLRRRQLKGSAADGPSVERVSVAALELGDEVQVRGLAIFEYDF